MDALIAFVHSMRSKGFYLSVDSNIQHFSKKMTRGEETERRNRVRSKRGR